jgi:hypothetical protein
MPSFLLKRIEQKKVFLNKLRIMSSAQIKNKIFKSLEDMDAEHLQSAYRIIKEFSNQQKYSNVEIKKEQVDEKIARGIQQLDKGESSSFEKFLKEMNSKYADKK